MNRGVRLRVVEDTAMRSDIQSAAQGVTEPAENNDAALR